MFSRHRETMSAPTPCTWSVFRSSRDWEIGQASPGRLTTGAMSHAIMVIQPLREHCMNRALESFANSVTARALRARSLILGIWQENKPITAVPAHCTAKEIGRAHV